MQHFPRWKANFLWTWRLGTVEGPYSWYGNIGYCFLRKCIQLRVSSCLSNLFHALSRITMSCHTCTGHGSNEPSSHADSLLYLDKQQEGSVSGRRRSSATVCTNCGINGRIAWHLTITRTYTYNGALSLSLSLFLSSAISLIIALLLVISSSVMGSKWNKNGTVDCTSFT